MEIEITYMSGAGNIFSVVDNRKYILDHSWFVENISEFCRNVNESDNKNIEGLIVLEDSESLDFNALFFNPDGSTGAMCGNGGRCAVNFALLEQFFDGKNTVKFSMANEKYEAELLRDGRVKLTLPPPIETEFNSDLKIDDNIYHYDLINVNSDHLVLNFKELYEINDKDFRNFPIGEFAKKFRYSKKFPRGVNVNIFEVNNNKINIRTYERGVEAETGACGTGAISTALSAYRKKLIDLPVTLIPPSMEEISVDIIFNNDSIIHFELSGNALVIGKRILQIN